MSLTYYLEMSEMAGKSPSDLIEALKNLGLKNKEASVLSFLMKNYKHPVSQWDIERALELRQPYVSSALRTLEHNKWVEVSAKIKEPGVYGRPENIYQLKVSPDRIAKDLKTQYLSKCEVLKRSVSVIKNASSG